METGAGAGGERERERGDRVNPSQTPETYYGAMPAAAYTASPSRCNCHSPLPLPHPSEKFLRQLSASCVAFFTAQLGKTYCTLGAGENAVK